MVSSEKLGAYVLFIAPKQRTRMLGWLILDAMADNTAKRWSEREMQIRASEP
jgi:hypothetical protein